MTSLFELWSSWNGGERIRGVNRGWELYVPRKMRRKFVKTQKAVDEKDAADLEAEFELWDTAETCKTCKGLVDPFNGSCRCHYKCKRCNQIPDDVLWTCGCTTKKEFDETFCRRCTRYDPEKDCVCC